MIFESPALTIVEILERRHADCCKLYDLQSNDQRQIAKRDIVISGTPHIVLVEHSEYKDIVDGCLFHISSLSSVV